MATKFYAMLSHATGFSDVTITGQNYTDSFGTAKSSGDTAYDLYDYQLSTQAVIDTSGETTDPTINVTTTNDMTANACLLMNHTMAAAGAEAEITAGAGGTVLTPTGSTGVLGGAWSQLQLSGTNIRPTLGGFTAVDFSETTENHWGVDFSEIPASYDDDISLGQVIIAKSFSPSHHYILDSTSGYVSDGVTLNVTVNGQRYGQTWWGPQRQWSLSWQNLTATDKENFEDFYTTCNGAARPFLFYDDREDHWYWCRLTQRQLTIRPKAGDYTAFDITLQFQEEV
jgi:hypothetical protein